MRYGISFCVCLLLVVISGLVSSSWGIYLLIQNPKWFQIGYGALVILTILYGFALFYGYKTFTDLGGVAGWEDDDEKAKSPQESYFPKGSASSRLLSPAEEEAEKIAKTHT